MTDIYPCSGHRLKRSLLSILLLAVLLPGTSMAGPNQRTTEALTLAELERLAMEKNPTLVQADAAVKSSEGRKVQAGLYPNPEIGYLGEELSYRAFSETSEHLLFVEQTFVTAGKLSKSRRIFAHEQEQAEAEREAQKLRILNSVRMAFYEVLGRQALVELKEDLARIAREAVKVSEQLFNVGAADRPDALEAEIEAEQAELDVQAARNNLLSAWRVLTGVVGDPSLEIVPLAGDLEQEMPDLEEAELRALLLQESPELRQSDAGVERAKAALARARVEAVPDIRVRAGIGYNFERLDTGGPTGLESFVEAGIRIPLFDRNQGNVGSARADIIRAENEVQRLRLALGVSFDRLFAEYLNSRGTVDRYRLSVLPKAGEAYQLYLGRFQQMAAAYPQVLIAQRTYSQVRTSYVEALVDTWQHIVLLKGLLLAGALDAPREVTSEVPRAQPGISSAEISGIDSMMQGAGIQKEPQ